MYSIASQQQDNAPRTLRVDAKFSFTDMKIKLGDIVTAISGVLYVGNMNIKLNSVLVWESVLPAFPKKQDMLLLKNNLHILRKYIVNYGRGGGLLKSHSNNTKIKANNIYTEHLAKNSQKFLKALYIKNFQDAHLWGSKLIGLGGGLTPSGDDFCAGIITIFHMCNSPFDEEYKNLGFDLATIARKQTTAVSQEMIILAAQGKTRENIIALLRAAISSQPLKNAILKILKIGSLSGTDLAIGLISGLELGVELTK